MPQINIVSHHAFGARSAHPTTSPIILLGGNPAEDEKLYSIKDNHMYDV